MKKIGILLVNIGSPDSSGPSAVRKYLREFLGDRRVIDIPSTARWLLLNLIILPFRPKKSSAAYTKIWTERGSPLVSFTHEFADKLRESLPDTYLVEYGMRYGNPSLHGALEALLKQGIGKLIVFPLYPQYSSAATGSSVEEIFRILSGKWNVPYTTIKIIEPFFSDPGFIESWAQLGKPLIEEMRPDHILFSYHGLPERQIRKSECQEGYCLKTDNSCCEKMSWQNQYCYRGQSFETTRLLAGKLGLADDAYTICFQSRLGRTPWIKPYTDEVLVKLAQRGIKRLLVFCPSFVSDCLETLEEIRIRGRESFIQAGGEDLVMVPSLNGFDAWVKAAGNLILSSAVKPLPHQVGGNNP